MTLCMPCEQIGPGHPSREPVLVGDVLVATNEALAHAARTRISAPAARSSSTVRCKSCGAHTSWHRTARGRWIMIESGDWPIGPIPAGRRWRIAGDGTAVNLGAASPSDTCRVSHFDVCPSRAAPVDSPALLALWRRNAQPGH